jgi:hypothetical protein
MDGQVLHQSMRLAEPDDLNDILALRREVIGGELHGDDAAYLRWRYPFGRAEFAFGALWVLRREGELLAIIGVEKLALSAGSREWPFYRVMDILIRPEWRDAGLGLWMNQFIGRQYGNLLAVGSNERSAGLVARAFAQLPDRRAFIRPILLNHVLNRHIGLAPLAAGASFFANLALKLHGRLVLWPGRGDIEVRRGDAVPEDVGDLINRATNSKRIEVVRSAHHWTWRMASPQARFDMWEARHPRDQSLRGFMVTRIAEPEPGRIVCTVMDMVLAEAEKSQVVRALLRTALSHAERHHAEFILWIGYRHDIEPDLVRAGFVRRPGDGLAMSWSCKDEFLTSMVSNRPDWTFNELHTDSD